MYHQTHGPLAGFTEGLERKNANPSVQPEDYGFTPQEYDGARDAPGETQDSIHGAKPNYLPVDQFGVAAFAHDRLIGQNQTQPAMSLVKHGNGLLRIALVTAAVILVFGLGWIAGLNWNRIFGFASGYFNPDASRPINIVGGEIVTTLKKADRETRAAIPKIRNASAASVSGVAPDSLHALPPTRTAESRAPSIAELIAAASGPALAPLEHKSKIATRLTPAPETKPTSIEGWTVREVIGGTAVLVGPNGILRAKRGDTLPGIGRVDSILRWGSHWIVVTSSGLISTQ